MKTPDKKEVEISEKTPVASKNNKKKKTLSIVLGVIAIILLVGSIQYLRFNKAMQDRRDVMTAQRQIMVDSWKDEGLTDEEITTRLKEQSSRYGTGDRRSPNPFFMIQRVILGGGRARGEQR